MDPLSITTGIVALAELTVKIFGLISSAKDAPEDRNKLRTEIATLHPVLVRLQLHLESLEQDGGPNSTAFEHLVGIENGPLAQYREALEELHSHMNKNGAAKASQTMQWKWKRIDITGILKKLERLKNSIQTTLLLDTSEAVQQTKRNTEIIRQMQDQREHTELLEWVSKSNFPAQHLDIIEKVQSNTGSWFLESAQFKTWIQGPKQTLFCPGMPGAGKTMISSIVIDFLTLYTQETNTGLCYFFCNHKSTEDQTALMLFSALLKQIAQILPLAREKLRVLHRAHSAQMTRPTLDEIFNLLRDILAGYSATYVVIDALDEFSAAETSRENLIARLKSLQEQTNTNIMITSRPTNDMRKPWPAVPIAEVRASKEDISAYVRGRIGDLPRFVRQNVEIQLKIQDAIVGTADGMFLLARLHFDSLKDKTSVRDVKTAVEMMSRRSSDSCYAYDEAYSEASERISQQPEGHRTLALKVLGWVTHARRQLTVVELQHALAIRKDDEGLDDIEDALVDPEHMIAYCAGLVVIDEESSIVRLVHYTTQEYFERTWKTWMPESYEDIAVTCLVYLRLTCSWALDSTERLPDDCSILENQVPLLGYAATYWVEHISGLEEQLKDMALQVFESRNADAIFEFGLRTRSTGRWVGSYRPKMDKLNVIHWGAAFGAPKLSELLYKRLSCNAEHMIDAQYSDMTPLEWAESQNHPESVQWLLEKGADVSIHQRRMFAFAAMYGHEQIVRILTNAPAGTPSMSSLYVGLVAAIESDHAGIVRFLLENGVNPNTQGDSNSSEDPPFIKAARHCHVTCMRALLDHGADPGIMNGHQTALYAACDPFGWGRNRNQPGAIRLLLELGADPNPKNNPSLLYELARRGRGEPAQTTEAVSILLEAGAIVESQALYAAAQSGNHEILAVLLKRIQDIAPDPELLLKNAIVGLVTWRLSRTTSTTRQFRPLLRVEAFERTVLICLARGASILDSLKSFWEGGDCVPIMNGDVFNMRAAFLEFLSYCGATLDDEGRVIAFQPNPEEPTLNEAGNGFTRILRCLVEQGTDWEWPGGLSVIKPRFRNDLEKRGVLPASTIAGAEC